MKRQIILDTETTGLDHSKGHRLTEIGCLEMVNRRLTGRRFQTYLNPEREIDEGARAVTGLTLEFLQDKPKFVDVVEEFLAFLQIDETELIIHNAPFDLGFLNAELIRMQHAWQPIENYLGVVDTLIMARQLHPGQRNNLDALCKRYSVDNTSREFHGALLDAQLLAKVYLAMTAGQTDMMAVETVNIESQQVKVSIKAITRSTDKPLKVIRATEEESRLHFERLEKLAKN
jgi:DNA polymerase-3 subunit epsilon